MIHWRNVGILIGMIALWAGSFMVLLGLPVQYLAVNGLLIVAIIVLTVLQPNPIGRIGGKTVYASRFQKVVSDVTALITLTIYIGIIALPFIY